MHPERFCIATIFGTIAALACGVVSSAPAADDLSLRKGISFDQDTDNGFPVMAKNIDDATLEPGLPSIIFFGASGDLNTNRQAKRLVNLYQKFKAKRVKFIVIDVDRPANKDAKTLLKKYYKSYIPSQVILDGAGKMTWSTVGEVQEKIVADRLEEELKKTQLKEIQTKEIQPKETQLKENQLKMNQAQRQSD